jgi:hypothetical protein
MDTYSDIELVQRSVSGDARAFEHLVNRHYMTVYGISYKWCGVKQDAEIIALAGAAGGKDEFGFRTEFLNLVRLAKTARAMGNN